MMIEMGSWENEVTLTNQQIIEFAYLTKEMIELCLENNAKLFFEQANCYPACFYKVRELLKLAFDADFGYGASHGAIREFYQEGRELSNEWERLKWITPAEASAVADAISIELPF